MSNSIAPWPSLPTLYEIKKQLAAEKDRRLNEDKLDRYRPYPKQKLFHDLSAGAGERLLRAGNQQGKTHAGAMELAIHLTGRYPDWWQGHRFGHMIDAWAACDTGETTRDNPQRALLGPVAHWGTGAIPADALGEIKRGRGVADLVDTVLVKHESGGFSRLGFKRYDQGRESWQGTAKHVIWCDEEPPAGIYGEALARLVATRGFIYTTFTPLKGLSEVVTRLMRGGEGIADVNMTIEDAEHIAPEERARIVAAFPEHEREARANGVPILGSGRVFPVAESDIRVDAFEVPPHWALIGAMDFGWDHPFAAVKLAWDRDADCVYVTNAYRVREQTPVVHAAALRPWGPRFKWAWPHDGMQHDKGSGDTLAAQYRAQGLNMLRAHATHGDGGIGLEAGVMAMLDRMKTGRLKVFAHLSEWFEEFRLYHRKDGLIVKERDDLLSATRIGLMMLRAAASPEDARTAPTTADSDYDPLR
ncbi:MAG: terminase large subunit domain-containing protein [Micropepsaceae bacterium]